MDRLVFVHYNPNYGDLREYFKFLDLLTFLHESGEGEAVDIMRSVASLPDNHARRIHNFGYHNNIDYLFSWTTVPCPREYSRAVELIARRAPRPTVVNSALASVIDPISEDRLVERTIDEIRGDFWAELDCLVSEECGV